MFEHKKLSTVSATFLTFYFKQIPL